MPLPSSPGAQPRAASAVLGRREPLLQVLLPDVPVEFVAAAEQQAAGHALQRHGNLRFVVASGLQVSRGPARPAIDAGPLARALWCRGGRVLVVVVGAAQPVGLGRDGLVLDHGGAAVWYRPVVRMRHR